MRDSRSSREKLEPTNEDIASKLQVKAAGFVYSQGVNAGRSTFPNRSLSNIAGQNHTSLDSFGAFLNQTREENNYRKFIRGLSVSMDATSKSQRVLVQMNASHRVDAVTQRYGPGFEGWDHYKASYITDYAIGFVCLLCMGVVFLHAGLPRAWWHFSLQFQLCLLLTCLAYVMQGIALQLLDGYYESGQTMGIKWSSNNSMWLGFWLAGMVFAPFADASYICLALTFSNCSRRLGYLMYLLGLGAAIYELVILILGLVFLSGVWLAYVDLLRCLASMLLFGLSRGHFSRIFAVIGAFLELLGVGLVLSAPGSCKKEHPDRGACFYPRDFNQNAFYHVSVIVSIVFISHAVARKHKQVTQTDDTTTPLREGDAEHQRVMAKVTQRVKERRDKAEEDRLIAETFGENTGSSTAENSIGKKDLNIAYSHDQASSSATFHHPAELVGLEQNGKQQTFEKKPAYKNWDLPDDSDMNLPKSLACSVCGHKNSATAKFCEECGNLVRQITQANSGEKTSTSIALDSPSEHKTATASMENKKVDHVVPLEPKQQKEAVENVLSDAEVLATGPPPEQNLRGAIGDDEQANKAESKSWFGLKNVTRWLRPARAAPKQNNAEETTLADPARQKGSHETATTQANDIPPLAPLPENPRADDADKIIADGKEGIATVAPEDAGETFHIALAESKLETGNGENILAETKHDPMDSQEIGATALAEQKLETGDGETTETKGPSPVVLPERNVEVTASDATESLLALSPELESDIVPSDVVSPEAHGVAAVAPEQSLQLACGEASAVAPEPKPLAENTETLLSGAEETTAVPPPEQNLPIDTAFTRTSEVEIPQGQAPQTKNGELEQETAPVASLEQKLVSGTGEPKETGTSDHLPEQVVEDVNSQVVETQDAKDHASSKAVLEYNYAGQNADPTTTKEDSKQLQDVTSTLVEDEAEIPSKTE